MKENRLNKQKAERQFCGGSNWKHENPIINFSKQKANYPRHYIIHFNAEYWNNRENGWRNAFLSRFSHHNLELVGFQVERGKRDFQPSSTRYGSKVRHSRLKTCREEVCFLENFDFFFWENWNSFAYINISLIHLTINSNAHFTHSNNAWLHVSFIFFSTAS